MSTNQLREALRRYSLAYLLLLPALILIMAILVYPGINVVWLSLHQVKLITIDQPFNGLDNYQAVLSTRLLRKVVINSFVWTFGSMALQFLLGFSSAVVLHRGFKGSHVLRGFLLAPWVMPGIVIAVIWRWMLSPDYGVLNHFLVQLGLIRTYQPWLAQPTTAMLSVVLANAWKGFPFWMIMISTGLSTISEDIYDAAVVDGASGWRLLRYITLPLLKLPLFVTSTLAFIWTFNYFDLIFGMTHGGPIDATRTVPIYIWDTAFIGFRMGEASAASVLLLGLMTAVVFAYSRLLRIQAGGELA